MSVFDRRRVVALTEKYGGEWAVHHAQRLIQLVAIIGEGLSYDADAIWIAAHMHDWGTLPQWSRSDVPHSLRSCQLAEEHLRRMKCPKPLMARVLEAIEYHHGGAGERCVEAILLRDADALDGMGAIGVLREFAMVPTEVSGCYSIPTGWGMRGAYERARMRLENNPRMLGLPKSRQIARRRAREMSAILKTFEQESFGLI
jgi:HD superfamily phosphodiesterase